MRTVDAIQKQKRGSLANSFSKENEDKVNSIIAPSKYNEKRGTRPSIIITQNNYTNGRSSV